MTPSSAWSLEDRDPKFALPLDIEIDSGKVGGPSAGLAFSLGVLDRLTPGSLTGGKPVAVTGAIASDGSVARRGRCGAEDGGGAVDAGATLFLVPPGEYAHALRSAGDLEVRQGVHARGGARGPGGRRRHTPPNSTVAADDGP